MTRLKDELNRTRQTYRNLRYEGDLASDIGIGVRIGDRAVQSPRRFPYRAAAALAAAAAIFVIAVIQSQPVVERSDQVRGRTATAYSTGGVGLPRLAGPIIPQISTRRMPSLFRAEGTMPSIRRYPTTRPKLNLVDPSHHLLEQTL